MKLSENFTLKEMTKSATATRKGIDNTPTEEHIQNLKDLAENVLQPARDKFGRIDTNSGYRSVALCIAVGSNQYSNHAQGLAADIEATGHWSNFELFEYIYKNLEFKELIAEYFDPDDKDAGWVHVAFQEGNNKGEVKLKDKDHHYKQVEFEYIQEIYG